MPKMIHRPMGGKMLPRNDDDDDEDEDEDEDEEEEQTQTAGEAGSSSGAPMQAADDDEEEEEEEEEAVESDDEEEEETQVSRKSKKPPKERPSKKQRRDVNQFIEREAEAEDDDEEEDEDDDEEEEGEHEDDEGAENIRPEVAERQARELDSKRRKEEEAKLAEYTQNRYESGRVGQRWSEDDEDGDSRFQELPDASKDPKLWLLRCKPGHERLLVRPRLKRGGGRGRRGGGRGAGLTRALPPPSNRRSRRAVRGTPPKNRARRRSSN